MPFITQDRRTAINEHGLGVLGEIAVGDVCYAYYKPMVDAWKANPRWTTAHNIHRDFIYTVDNDPDCFAAYSLAWQVFFFFYVLPYEIEKCRENGNI